jgi:hypothetical protein
MRRRQANRRPRLPWFAPWKLDNLDTFGPGTRIMAPRDRTTAVSGSWGDSEYGGPSRVAWPRPAGEATGASSDGHRRHDCPLRLPVKGDCDVQSFRRRWRQRRHHRTSVRSDPVRGTEGGLKVAEAKQRKNRGHGEGAIQKRSDGRWMAQLMVGNRGNQAGWRSCFGRLRDGSDAARRSGTVDSPAGRR